MAGKNLAALGKVLVRRRALDATGGEETHFARCLSTLALVSMGVGSTLGAGIYVLAGEVAQKAGPAVVLSFLLAGIASLLAGLCYAEFGARVNRTGSAYLYAYVTVGEVWAFATGWILVLSYIVAAAAVAKGWASTFDNLVDQRISGFFRDNMAIRVPGGVFAEYPDFFVLLLLLLLTGLLAFGAKESSVVNKVFTVVNLLVLAFSVLFGLVKGDPANWNLTLADFQAFVSSTNSTKTAKEHFRAGGFTPFGLAGVLSGAGSCFFAFAGFHNIATMSEEAKNPRRSIPVSIMATLLICFLAYFGVAAALTFMMPYYQVDAQSPLPVAFGHVGWHWARYAVAMGSLCAMATSMLGCVFAAPRVLYAMAEDGLLFHCLSRINGKTKTPVLATLVSGGVAAVMGSLFNLRALVDLAVIGLLWSYILVAICVVILRYQPGDSSSSQPEEEEEEKQVGGGGDRKEKQPDEEEEEEGFSLKLLLFPSRKIPTRTSGAVAYAATVAVTALIAALCAALPSELPSAGAGRLSACAALATLCLAGMAVIWRQPQANTEAMGFKVPLLPALPLLSVLINIYLMAQLDRTAWSVFAVFMALGFAIYFLYGIRNSRLSDRRKGSQ